MTTEAIRKGDRFEITVTVSGSYYEDIWWCEAAGGTCANIKMTTAELLAGRRLPRPIGVGDRVRWGNGTLGRVEAIRHSDAWVLWDGSTEPITERIRDLTLVESSHD